MVFSNHHSLNRLNSLNTAVTVLPPEAYLQLQWHQVGKDPAVITITQKIYSGKQLHSSNETALIECKPLHGGSHMLMSVVISLEFPTAVCQLQCPIIAGFLIAVALIAVDPLQTCNTSASARHNTSHTGVSS